MTPVAPHHLTLATQEHYLQSYALPIQPKNARAQWSEFSVVKSDDDNDDDFLYHQSPFYHCNPADKSDDSLSDISYHDNDKHDKLSSDLLCQEDEQTNSASERQSTSTPEREGVIITQ
jgi:hypothetical protein